MSKVFNSTK